jgi:hypothetical protein
MVILNLNLGLGLAARARADTSAELGSAGAAVAYVVPLGCSAIASVANAAYMGVNEGAPRYLRTTGVVCGLAATGVGTYLIITSHETPGHVALGTFPVVVGLTSVLLAIIVGAPDDVVGPSALSHVVPLAFQGGGQGLGFATTF